MQLEYCAWSDKLAIDAMRPVAPARRVSALTNDRIVQRASQMLVDNDITPLHFLKSVCYTTRAGVLNGLQIESDSESEDSDED